VNILDYWKTELHGGAFALGEISLKIGGVPLVAHDMQVESHATFFIFSIVSEWDPSLYFKFGNAEPVVLSILSRPGNVREVARFHACSLVEYNTSAIVPNGVPQQMYKCKVRAGPDHTGAVWTADPETPCG